jgi:membrane-associated protease RseP (regulator of RpoE activity)
MLPVTALTLALAGGFWWAADAEAQEAASRISGWQVLQQMLIDGAPYAFWVLVILGSHEMGHYLACRYHGIPATLPFFIPGPPPIGSFGAVIRIRGPIPHRKALFDVAAAGPIAGFVVALPVLTWGLLTAQPPAAIPAGEAAGQAYIGAPVALMLLQKLSQPDAIQSNALLGAGWVGMLVTSLNLFPVGQLDGGHAAYAIGRGVHRLATRLTLVALVLLIAAQIYWLEQFPAYLLWFAILLWMRDRHPRLLDETSPLGSARRLVAALLLLLFLFSFIPVPFVFSD